MSRPQPRAPLSGARPPFRPRPRIDRRYEASVTGGYAVDFHADDCPCDHCAPVAAAAPRPADPPLPVVGLTFAAIVTANAIAFAWDPAGSWSALRAAVLHLVGAR